MHVNKILNDVTVLFTGYNIKPFAILAIESFLLHNPQLRKNVVFFDDESTDGTREELEARGIKIITWLPQIKKKFDEFEKATLGTYHVISCLPQRCSFINYCAAMQIKTRYLFISDGDIVYFNNFFLHCVDKFAQSNCLIAGSTASIPIDIDMSVIEYLEVLDKGGFLIKTEKGFERVKIYPNQMLLDIKELKNRGIMFDNINAIHPYDDTGHDFYRQLIQHQIPHIEVIDFDEIHGVNNWFMHLYNLASLRRINNINYKNNMVNTVRNNFSDTRVFDVCDRLGINLDEICKDFINYIIVGNPEKTVTFP